MALRDSGSAVEGVARGRRPSFFRPSLRFARRAALVWGLFLLALTSWPSPPEIPVISRWVPNFDKLAHAFLYGVEGFFLYFAVAWPPAARPSWLRALPIAGALAIFGTLDEVHQAWIPGRSMEGADALADSVAALLGGIAATAVARTSTSAGAPDRAAG